MSLDGPFADLLDEIESVLRRYIVLGDAEAIAVALWVAHTHAVGAFGITPYLSITSAEKASGKTLLLELLELLVARPWLTGSVTAATLARKIDVERPTLLLDESDAAFNGDRQYAETLRGVLNTGFRASGAFSRCVGSSYEVVNFSTFSAKAIAGIGKLPDTAESRSIPIRLKRRAPHENVSRWRERVVRAEAEPLRIRLAEWGEAHEEALGTYDLAAMKELPDRAADIWEPLLAIARLAGDRWFGRAQKAAITLSGRAAIEDDSNGVRLLADVRSIFDFRRTDKLFSDQLVTALVGLEEAPWSEWNGRPITKTAVARLLRPYGIRPSQVRIDDQTRKGYERSAFGDAWSRYLREPPAGAGTTETTASSSEKSVVDIRRDPTVVSSSESHAKPHAHTDVSDVSDVADVLGSGRGARVASHPALGDPTFLPRLYERLEDGFISEGEWQEADRAHRFVAARQPV